jgi:hypothetical protein
MVANRLALGSFASLRMSRGGQSDMRRHSDMKSRYPVLAIVNPLTSAVFGLLA